MKEACSPRRSDGMASGDGASNPPSSKECLNGNLGYPFLDVMWTMFVFFMFFIWIIILFRVFADLFRRRDIDGGLKVAWFAFVIVLPFGVFVYLLSQGHKMADRDVEHMQAARAQQHPTSSR